MIYDFSEVQGSELQPGYHSLYNTQVLVIH